MINAILLTECGSNKFQFDGETTTCMELVTTDGITWEDARKHCQQHEGGDLVSITSKSKWDFIMGNFKSKNINKYWKKFKIDLIRYEYNKKLKKKPEE